MITSSPKTTQILASLAVLLYDHCYGFYPGSEADMDFALDFKTKKCFANLVFDLLQSVAVYGTYVHSQKNELHVADPK